MFEHSVFERIKTGAVLLSILLAMVMAAVSGCGKPSVKERLVGKWKGKVELNEELVRKELAAAGDPNAKLVFEALKKMEVNIEFRPDGKMTMAASTNTPLGEQKESVEAKWEVISASGDNVTIKSTRDEDPQQNEEIELTLEDEQTFSTRPPGPNREIGVLRMRKLR